MPLETKAGWRIELPTPEEDAAINAGIATDPDTYELSAEEFAQLRPVGESKAEPAKEQITIPLSREVAEYFRSTGKGWQNRVDEALSGVCRNSSVVDSRITFQHMKSMRSGCGACRLFCFSVADCWWWDCPHDHFQSEGSHA